MAKSYKEIMERYTKRIEELSGVKLQFSACNGEWCSSGFTPWSYLCDYHSIREICLYMEGIIAGMESVQQDFRRKYGMSIQEVCDKIAAFTGDKKTEAMRKARIFRKSCYVPLTKVTDIVLSFGKYSDGHGNYYGENRNTLHFKYKDSDGGNHLFSILE